MKSGRAGRSRHRALIVALALALAGSSAVPIVSVPLGTVRAQGGEGKIVHSSDGVLLRAKPAFEAEVLKTLPEGTTVGLRTDVADTVYDPDGTTQWWPVSTDGNDGWVAGFYLDIEGSNDATTTATEPPVAAASLGGESADDGNDGLFLESWQLADAAAMVAEPDGVNVREDPGAESPTVKTLSYETVVQLRVDEADTVYTEGSRWWPVRVDGLIGWVSGKYLEPTDTWTEPDASADTSSVADDISSKIAGLFEAGSYVMADTDDGSGINIRADGAPDAERIGIVPEGDVVQVMDGPSYDPIGNPWYLVTEGDVTGFVSGWYLSRADQPGQDLAQTGVASKLSLPGVATGTFEYPLASYTMTQGFGCSPYYFEPWNGAVGCNFHNGIDLATDAYSPIYAADGGTVEYAGWCDCGLGYYVKIDHGNGFATLYGHMAEPPYVTAGQAVSKGDVIGPVGSTGMSTGPHVHFIVDYDGVDQDPLTYLPY